MFTLLWSGVYPVNDMIHSVILENKQWFLGDETLSPIEFASRVIAMFVHVDSRGRFWKFISVKFVTLTVSVQSKGNTQSFMCYRFATTCTYVNSSYVEYALIVSNIVVYSFPPLLPSCCDCCCIAPGIYFHLSRLE